MSYKRDDKNEKSGKTRSNYFQTEFTITFNKKKEEKSGSSSSSQQSITDEKFNIEQQKKKNISVQADRDIIGQEEIPKERKKWIRPPLVGQASTSTDIIIPVNQDLPLDSDEEIIESSQPTLEPTNFISRTDYFRNRKDYINEKPPEGGSGETDISPIGNQNEYIKSASPTSSVTSSRPLEWDSGADVGYFQFYSGQTNDANLSTLERLALQRGTASLLKRSDPEGTTCSNVQPSNTVVTGRPAAESTPVNTLMKKKDDTAIKKANYPLFPEVIIHEFGQISDTDIEINKTNNIPVKKSNSLETFDKKKSETRPATFPRSQSQSDIVFNINNHLQKILTNNKSNSSSSVATVVTGKKKIITNNSPESENSTADRANSFEYLPGHIYENSNKTDCLSSALIEGLEFKDDIEKGVQLLTDFVKGSNANNTFLRKQLLNRVVEELISAEYLSDHEWSPILKRCVTRRSHNRDISGESSTVDEDPSTRRTDKESVTGPSSALTNGTVSNSSQNTSESKTSESLFKCATKKTFSAKKFSILKKNDSKQSNNSTDLTQTSSSDWKQPYTKSEKIFEAKKFKDYKEALDGKLLKYLYSERENQIDWIKKEINHLSNLKQLLEKHENLRKNFAILKKNKQKALSADALKSFRPKVSRKKADLSNVVHSEPTFGYKKDEKNKLDNENTVESEYDSHHYDINRGDGIRRRHASTDTRELKITDGWMEMPKMKKSLAYTIIFEPEKDKENINYESENGDINNGPVVDRETLMINSRHKIKEQFSKMSLQDELLSKRPNYVAKAEERRQIVAELTALRELRQQKKVDVLTAVVCNSEQSVPPHPLAVKRIVSQRDMRKLTEKKYKQTFEVQQRKQDMKRKEDYRTNRLMAEIFKKKLQKRTLKGETDLSNSINVISNY